MVQLAKHAAVTRHAKDGHKEFLNYYLKLISINLMKNVARTMFAKAIGDFSVNPGNPRTQVREGNRVVFTEEFWDSRNARQFVERFGD